MGAKAKAELAAARAKHGNPHDKPAPAGSGPCVQCQFPYATKTMQIAGGQRNGFYKVCNILGCGVAFAGEADFHRAYEVTTPNRGLRGGDHVEAVSGDF